MGSDQRVVRCARVSFAKDEKTEEERDKKLIRYLYRHRHASPFEHCVLAYEGKKEEWLSLLSAVNNPAFQAYWAEGFVFLNLRNAINAWEYLPEEVKEKVREAFPTVYAVVMSGGDIGEEELKKVPYSRDSAFLREKRETASGWVGLVDALELGTSMDYYTFVVECPLFVARQWMRHRFGSYNEVSKRYVGTEYLDFYLPPFIRRQAQKNKQASLNEPVEGSEELLLKVKEHLSKSKDLYEEILRRGGARELARGVLPQFMKTRFYWTVPRLSLDNFISLRTHEGAQLEIRELAEALKEMVGYGGTERRNRL